MNELIRRFSAKPWITVELVLASLFANLLALASPLFVIQVLNRYVSYGVDSTLATLTLGVVGAIALEYIFRKARMMLVAENMGETDEQRSIGAFGIMVTAKTSALSQFPAGRRRETLRSLDSIETAYNAANISAVLDVPFALLFLLSLALLSPTLGGVASLFIIAVFVYSVVSRRLIEAPTRQLMETAAAGNTLIATSGRAADTIRAFNGADLIMPAWRSYIRRAQTLRSSIGNSQGQSQSVSQSAQALMGVAVIAVGAMLVVAGKLDVGILIGANIMASRALGPIIKLANLSEAMTKASQALKQAQSLTTLPVENDGGTALSRYAGAIEFKDFGFSFPKTASPLFESLTLKIAPGAVLVVTGRNGCGKTTFCRLLVGLLEPTRGQLLIDGVDLRQTAPSWWRRQIMYLPQEPNFLDGSIRENLLTANPKLDEDAVNRIIREADMGRFIDESPKGLETEIVDNGDAMARGIRRRMALARAMATDGMLAIFDEPTESLDDDGCAAVFTAMKALSSRGRTMIIATSDQRILRGARLVLDLNVKPAPRIIAVTAGGEQSEERGKT